MSRHAAPRQNTALAAIRRTALAAAMLLGVGATLAVSTPAQASEHRGTQTHDRTTPAAPQSAQAEPRIEKLPYSDALYLVSETGAAPQRLTFEQWRDMQFPRYTLVYAVTGARYVQQETIEHVYALVGADIYRLTFERWIAAGTPTPERVDGDVVKYPFFDDLFLVTKTGTDARKWIWHHLEGQQWASLGSPRAQEMTWVQGTLYYQKRNQQGGFGPDIYAYLHGEYYKLNAQEWANLGYPAPIQGMPMV